MDARRLVTYSNALRKAARRPGLLERMGRERAVVRAMAEGARERSSALVGLDPASRARGRHAGEAGRDIWLGMCGPGTSARASTIESDAARSAQSAYGRAAASPRGPPPGAR